jgi:hypothetical protein
MNNKPRPGWKSCTITHLLLLLSYHDGEAFYVRQSWSSLGGAHSKAVVWLCDRSSLYIC